MPTPSDRSISEHSIPHDNWLMRISKLLLLIAGATACFGFISHRPPPERLSITPSAQPSAADLIKSGDDLMQMQRESNVSRLLDLAEKDYRAALALDPAHVDALLGLAWVSSTRHDFTRAVDLAHQALRIQPRLSVAYALLSDAAVELGDYDAAYQHCQTTLDLAPNLSSYSRAAHLLWLTGDPQQAYSLMEKAIKSGGTRLEHTAWCRIEFAQMHLQAGDLVKAEELAAHAFNAVPRHPRMLLTMGRIKAAQGQFKSAEQFFESALKSEASHDVLVALRDVQLQQNKLGEAEKTTQRLIKMHQLDSSHPSQLARFFADNDRNLPEALAAAQKARSQGKSIYVLDTLAWCLHKNGQHEKARVTIEEALKWNTPDASIHFHAGVIYLEIGESEKARAHFEKALQINPRFSPREAAVARRELARL